VSESNPSSSKSASSSRAEVVAGSSGQPGGGAAPQDILRDDTIVGELSAHAGAPPHHAPSQSLIGEQLGEFKIQKLLGRGGMAEVYLALQISLNRPVAVKVLRTGPTADEVNLRRFEQEARAAGGLQHPNIVQVYSVGEEKGIKFIAQEYVQGVNLREYIARRGPPEVPAALHIMRQVAAALQAAGEAGVVHRDIKPENILITRKGEVKVADFGLAQLTLQGQQMNLTQTGTTMGTPLYMSPEQVSGEKLDQRSDIYSFGVTCYHMLTGRPPFRGETALSVAVQHLNNVPQPLSELRGELPKPICQLVHKMMAKQPAERYADAQSVLRDLKRIGLSLKQSPSAAAALSLGHESGGEIAIPPGGNLFQRLFRKTSLFSRRRPYLAFVLGAVIVMGLSAGLGWAMRPGDPLKMSSRRDEKKSSIPRQQTAAEQYSKALLFEDEESLRAVIEYFPNDLFYRNAAEYRLGLWALRERRHDEAEQFFEKLRNGASADRLNRARGIGGLAILASLRGDHKESQRMLVFELEPLAAEVDSELSRLLVSAIEANRQALGSQVAVGYENRFRRDPPQ